MHRRGPWIQARVVGVQRAILDVPQLRLQGLGADRVFGIFGARLGRPNTQIELLKEHP